MFKLKKLEILLLKSYAGPLAMTFFISVFILVMQGLWRYSADIVGKGLDMSIMMELLFYVALQTVPMALPLAILLAALMTFGNLGEHYELTAIKASGISLIRIMKPLINCTIIISFIAFWFSNNVLPVANLKLYTLLASVKKARPEMEVKERVFYDGVDGFRIKVEHKNPKTGMLYDLIIHDHRDRINRNVNVTMADSGRMDIDSKNGTIKLTLYNGITYDEKVAMSNQRLTERQRQMYRKDIFTEEIFNLKVDGLDFTRVDENVYKGRDRMKNLSQLYHDTDSLQSECDSLTLEIGRQIPLQTMKLISSSYNRKSAQEMSEMKNDAICYNIDSLSNSLSATQRKTAYSNALRTVRSNKQYIMDRKEYYDSEYYKVVRHKIEQHRKFTQPIACLLFFFIGAPLGAIIRKGGLGTPIVISIVFFIFYYLIDNTGFKMAREMVWPVAYGMWLSTVALFAIGAFLTYKSATDSALFKSEAYIKYWLKIKPYFEPIIKAVEKHLPQKRSDNTDE